jgi:uncharacterized protein YqgV (UPF0045/DUF77 family)
MIKATDKDQLFIRFFPYYHAIVNAYTNRHPAAEMTLHAEISLYPLDSSDLTHDIASFLDQVESHGLHVTLGQMSSVVSGESSLLFTAIREAFEQCCDSSRAVLCMKVYNAVPPQSAS